MALGDSRQLMMHVSGKLSWFARNFLKTKLFFYGFIFKGSMASGILADKARFLCYKSSRLLLLFLYLFVKDSFTVKGRLAKIPFANRCILWVCSRHASA